MTTETRAEPPLDFSKVDALRKHLLMTNANMAELLGVSRMTYYNWVKGRIVTLSVSNSKAVRAVLRELLHIVTTQGWPAPEVLAMDQQQRKARLLELLSEARQ